MFDAAPFAPRERVWNMEAEMLEATRSTAGRLLSLSLLLLFPSFSPSLSLFASLPPPTYPIASGETTAPHTIIPPSRAHQGIHLIHVLPPQALRGVNAFGSHVVVEL